MAKNNTRKITINTTIQYSKLLQQISKTCYQTAAKKILQTITKILQK